MILGETVPGASFTVGELRLPRAVLAVAGRRGFGMAGVTFQTMLRNPLASPDVIGISSGASAAAVFAHRRARARARPAVSLLAIVAALATAAADLPARLQGRRRRHPADPHRHRRRRDARQRRRLRPLRGRAWDLQAAMRWLTGSLNGATWDAGRSRCAGRAAVVAPGPARARPATSTLLQLGDDTAAALGRPRRAHPPGRRSSPPSR